MKYVDKASGTSYTCGGLYFLRDDFFKKFSPFCRYISVQHKLENWDTYRHGRPHICIGSSNKTLLWMVPISSRVEKYELEIARQKQKYGACDKVQIVCLNTGKRAALIQNIIPCTPRYIDREYQNRRTGKVEEIGKADLHDICISARKLIKWHKDAPKCGFLFTDIFGIAGTLLHEAKTPKAEMSNKTYVYEMKG